MSDVVLQHREVPEAPDQTSSRMASSGVDNRTRQRFPEIPEMLTVGETPEGWYMYKSSVCFDLRLTMFRELTQVIPDISHRHPEIFDSGDKDTLIFYVDMSIDRDGVPYAGVAVAWFDEEQWHVRAAVHPPNGTSDVVEMSAIDRGLGVAKSIIATGRRLRRICIWSDSFHCVQRLEQIGQQRIVERRQELREEMGPTIVALAAAFSQSRAVRTGVRRRPRIGRRPPPCLASLQAQPAVARAGSQSKYSREDPLELLSAGWVETDDNDLSDLGILSCDDGYDFRAALTSLTEEGLGTQSGEDTEAYQVDSWRQRPIDGDQTVLESIAELTLSGVIMHVSWTPGHGDIEGNDMADVAS